MIIIGCSFIIFSYINSNVSQTYLHPNNPVTRAVSKSTTEISRIPPNRLPSVYKGSYTVQGGNPKQLNTSPAGYTLTFTNQKSLPINQSALATQDMFLDQVTSSKFSIRIKISSVTGTSLTFQLSSKYNNLIKNMVVRYLILFQDSQIVGNILILHINRVFGPVIFVKDTKDQALTVSHSFNITNTKPISTISCFTLYKNTYSYININLRNNLRVNQLDINITSSSQGKVYIQQINVTSILLRQQFTLRNMSGKFQLGSVHNYYGSKNIQLYRQYSLYSEDTIFLGISSLQIFYYYNYYPSQTTYRLAFKANINKHRIAIGQDKYSSAQIQIINFIFVPCNNTLSSYLEANGTCVASCPQTYIQNISSIKTCQPCNNCTVCTNNTFLNVSDNTCARCSQNCLACSSVDNCKLCSPHYQSIAGSCELNCSIIFQCDNCTINDTIITCLQCIQDYEVADNGTRCVPNCTTINHCIDCNASDPSAFVCIQCSALYQPHEGSCIENCSLILNCSQCHQQDNKLNCTKCSDGFQTNFTNCFTNSTNITNITNITNCGDGIYINGLQQCDNNNTYGCSKNCIIDDDYRCSSINGSKSQCYLKQIRIQYKYCLKVQDENSFYIFLKVSPQLKDLNNLIWQNGTKISDNNLKLTESSLDISSGLLTLKISYQKSLQSLSKRLQFIFQNMSLITFNTSSQDITLYLQTANNLSLNYYSPNQYNLALMIQYFSLAVSFLSILMLLLGFVGGKIIVLEYIGILQLTCICLIDVSDSSPTLAALRYLKLSTGFTNFNAYQYDNSIDRSFKGAGLTANPIQTEIVAIAFIFIPLLTGLVLKILSGTICKDNLNVNRIYPLILGQFTFYGIFYAAYINFTQFFLSISSISDSKQIYIGVPISFIFICSTILYCIFLNKYPEHFGCFKKDIRKIEMYSYFFTFIIIERLITSAIVVLLRNYFFVHGIILVSIIVLFICIFYKRPYVESNYRRQLINYCSSIIIICTLFINNMIKITIVDTYSALIISIVILLLTISNGYYFVKELKIILKSLCKQNGQQNHSYFDQYFKVEKNQTVEQKNKLQFDIFEQKLNSNFENQISIMNQTILTEQNTINKKVLDLQWQRYAILSKTKILDEMREKIKNRAVKN